MLDCLEPQDIKEPYAQGTLVKYVGEAKLQRTIWGPAKYMVEGKTVKVEEEDGSWTTDWVVDKIHGSPMPKKYVQKMSRAHTKQRKASDI